MMYEFSLFENIIFISFIVGIGILLAKNIYSYIRRIGNKEFLAPIVSKQSEIYQTQTLYNSGPNTGIQGGVVENIEIKYFVFNFKGKSVSYEVSDEIFNRFDEKQDVSCIVKNGVLVSINGNKNDVKNGNLKFVPLNSSIHLDK